MDLLILGGTRFLGRHLVGEALGRGHRVTLLNRGESTPGLFPEVEELRGERGGDLSELRGRGWDAVVDTSGYLPRDVRASAEILAGSVGHYTFVSSISVYRDFGRTPIDEEAPVLEPPDPEPEELDWERYGGLKVGCEWAAEAAMPGRLIVGPHDYTERFPYWRRRVAEGVRCSHRGTPNGRSSSSTPATSPRGCLGWSKRAGPACTTPRDRRTG